jgi:hypothetical protein
MISKWTDLSESQKNVLEGAIQPTGVFVPFALLRALKGDARAAILLSQMLFLTRQKTLKGGDEWIYLTTAQISRTFGIERGAQTRVRTELAKKGILETQEREVGSADRNYYRLDLGKIAELIAAEYDVVPANVPRSWKTRSLGGADQAPQGDGNEPPRVLETDPLGCSNRAPKESIKEIPVDTLIEDTNVSSLGARRASKKKKRFFVLEGKFGTALNFLVGTYPVDCTNRALAPNIAAPSLAALGNVDEDASEEERQAAIDRLTKLKKAVENYRAAYDRGRVNLGKKQNPEESSPPYLYWAEDEQAPQPGTSLTVLTSEGKFV